MVRSRASGSRQEILPPDFSGENKSCHGQRPMPAAGFAVTGYFLPARLGQAVTGYFFAGQGLAGPRTDLFFPETCRLPNP